MKCNRFSKEQIIGILKEYETDVPVAELCRKHGVSNAGTYKWKAKYGGMYVSGNWLKTIEDESAKLKKFRADSMLDNAARKDFLSKNGDALCRASGRRARSLAVAA